MARPDLLAEHAALTSELNQLQDLIAREWSTSFAAINRLRAESCDAIARRLAAIERTKTWRSAHPSQPAASRQINLEELIDGD